MQTLRVSASDLDALRYFMASEDGDLPSLLSQLRRELPPTPDMLAGTALHTALELAEPGEAEVLEADGYRFIIAADACLELPDIREMKVTADRQIGDVLVTLVGKVDGAHGRAVIDHKLTQRFDPERFLSTMQWRVYLDLFDADRFDWIVYEAASFGPDDREITIKAIHPLTMHRYPGMSEDVDRALSGFVDFAKIHLMKEEA